MTSNAALLTHLITLERELHDFFDPQQLPRLEALLHPRFREFGRSGGVYTRAQMIDSLMAQPVRPRIQAQNFVAQLLASEVCLLTYQSAHLIDDSTLVRHSNRASVWQLEAVGWQMVFHQGTATEPFGQNGSA